MVFFEVHTLPQTIGQGIIGLFFWIMVIKNLRVWQFNVDRTEAILPLPKLCLTLNFVLQFFAGLALLIDYQTSLAAIILIILIIISTAMFHRFWKMEDPLKNNYHMLLFFNNFAIIGALVMLI
jgi:uncharacterized membrane protein YphA (DoxX/SURF4 family)